MLQAHLKVVGGRQDGKLLSLPTGKFLIGREEDCNLRPKSELVSRHHCVFNVDEFTVRLRDLGSTNGTYVNEDRILGQVVLQAGDHVRIGKLEFEVRLTEVSEEAPAEQVELEETGGANSSDTIVDMPIPEGLPTEEFAEQQTMIDQPTPVPESPADVVLQPPMPVAGQPVPGYPGYPYPQYPPGYPPQPGYPPAMYPYPPQGAPGYPPMPGQPMPGQPMPGQPMPGQPMPGQPVPEQPIPQEETPTDPNMGANTETVQAPPVKLPDPSETGAKEPEPKPEAQPAAEGDGGGTDENPSQRAEDIIRQYMKRGD